MKRQIYDLDREKVHSLLRTKEGQWTEQWICALHDISPQTFARRCREGWNRESLIALASTLSDMTKLEIKYTDLIDLSGAGR